MILVDVHAHLDYLEDLDSVIDSAKKNNVKIIISNGINPETNRKTLVISKKYDIVKAALGIYPLELKELNEEEIEKELLFIKKNKDNLIGLGEVGIDYKYGEEIKNKQKDLFLKFIELSEKIKTPLIIHSRKAESDVIDLLESSKAKAVLHSFEGNFKLVKKATDLGYYFSIPTNIVRSEHFQKLVEETDINQLLTETDSPYLSPYPDKKNQPSFVIESVKKIADIKKLDSEEVANNIFMNYQKLF